MAIRSELPGAMRALAEIGWKPAGIIDLGVAQGTPGLYGTWPGTPICLVEPATEAGQFIDQIIERFPNVTAYRVGASNRAGTVSVRQHQSGIYVTFNSEKLKWDEIEIEVRPCDDIVREWGQPGPYLYKLDTDSHELEILEGSVETLKATDVVVVEMNMFNPLIRLTATNDIWRFLADHGFTLFDVADLRYSINSVARSADVVFVRQDSELFRTAWSLSAKLPKPKSMSLNV